jgi:hypothetical protein
MVKNAKVKRNNDGPGKCTKRGRSIKMVSPEKDYSKKVSSLPVIVCMYVFYRDYVLLLTCYTYIDICVIRSVYVYVAMFIWRCVCPSFCL